MRSPLAPLLAVALLALAGCGDGGGDGRSGDSDRFPRTVAGVQRCLDANERYDEVEPVDSTAGNVLGAKREVINRAVSGAEGGLTVKSGGPSEENGTITEAPVSVSEIYFFADAAEATRTAGRLMAASGDAGEQAVFEVRAVGPAVVVHYSFGPQDAPGGVPLDERELAPIEDCLRQAGYLAEGGDGSGENGFPRSVAGMKKCFEGEDYERVIEVPAGGAARGGLPDNERREVVRGTRGHAGGLVAGSGGPENRGGVLVEIPIRVSEVYFFADAAAARRAAARLARFVDSHLSPEVNAAEPIGPTVVVHHSYGVDGQGKIPFDAKERAPVEGCLRKTGYL